MGSFELNWICIVFRKYGWMEDIPLKFVPYVTYIIVITVFNDLFQLKLILLNQIF
jgi:hypothetical protein